MPMTITAPLTRPDETGAPAVPASPAGNGGWAETAWATITSHLHQLPGWAWPALAITVLAATLVAFPALRAQAKKAGARTNKTTLTAQDRQDRKLLIGALVPAVIFWAAVLIGSGRGLIAFAEDDLNWRGGWQAIVPLTLDGVAISFGLLAFRAVKKHRNPDRATRIAWGAMIASAGLNFFHEIDGSKLGAIYLAILSLLGMLIFHEFLAQFEEGTEHVARENPKFGLRWITWPSNTVCAWFAWQNHPQDRPGKATVANGVIHLETVRAKKKTAKAAKVDDPSWVERINPWARSVQLGAALAEQRSVVASERAQAEAIKAEAERRNAELQAAAERRISDEIAARNAEAKRRLEAIRSEAEQRVERAQAEAEQARSDMERMAAEHAAHVSRIREKNTPAPASVPARSSANTAPSGGGTEPRLSNDEAVALMLRTHPEPGYEWGTREVSRLTGAGMGRVPKLIAAVREHHARSGGTAARNGSDDDAQENAS